MKTDYQILQHSISLLRLIGYLICLFPLHIYAYSAYDANGIKGDYDERAILYSYSGIVDLSGMSWANQIGYRTVYIGTAKTFYECSVTNVRIPSNITTFGQFTFYNCQQLKRVLLESDSADFVSYFFDGREYKPFDRSYCKMYVPQGTGGYYRSKGLNVTIIDGFTSSGQLFSGSGSGTVDDPFLIFNPIQLNQVRNFLDEKYVHFKLMNDIDLASWLDDNNPYQGWLPIGTESSPFMGIFDGNNHKITGLYINRSANDNVGFFGCLLWAKVSNLNIEESVVKGNNYVGTLSGQAIGSDINNCRVSGTLTAAGDFLGGLLGCASGYLTRCNSNTLVKGKSKVGGIVGSSFNGPGAELHLTDCKSNNVVDGDSYTSLTIGYNNHYLFITLLESLGMVSSTGSNTGGVVGYSSGEKLEINNCSIYCDIDCKADTVGGIVGNVANDFNINNSFICGDIVSSGSYIGGITGYVSLRGNIKNTYYNGNLTGSGDYVGGIAGYANNANINQCYSYANIIGNSYVGGIAGEAPGSTITSNVSICGLISAVSGNVGRIYGSDDLSGVTLGECGTANENKGFARASVLLNGIAQDLPDGFKHGTNVGNATLKYGATYQGMGWDFNNWTIIETESYPYKAIQCAPPVITSTIEANATEISGNCTEDGTVTIVANGEEYITHCTDHQWTVQVSPLQAGSVVKVQADTEDKLPSYFVLNTVAFGGNGTEADPYSIYTADDLQNINSYAYYRLKADIDLTDWINKNNPSGGWVPIGASGNATMKQLDGNGHKITGLWCDNDLENCGLFATTNNAIIKDLTLFIADDNKVKGGAKTGSVVGFAKGTQFVNITVDGDVEGQENVGGIIGYGIRDDSDRYDTSLKYCSFNGSVTGDTYVGGLVGQSASVVSECYSQGSVTGNNTTCFVGGIVGYNRFIVEDCYSSANIIAGMVDNSIPISDRNQYAGGIVGDNSHTVRRCYSSGNLYAVKCAAGIAGYNTSWAAVVKCCYAMNKRIEVADASGIAMRVIGGIRNGAPTPEANNYALKTMVVSVNNIPQTIYDDLLHGQSLTDGALRKTATYQSNGWDMENVWKIDEDSSYPYLRAIYIQPDVERGDVDGDGSVNISDVTGLIDYLLSGNASGVVLAAADCDHDGNINISDVTALIDFLLSGTW